MKGLKHYKREAMTGNHQAQLKILIYLNIMQDYYGHKGMMKISDELGIYTLVNGWMASAKVYGEKINKK
jgi:hypothetical protein